MWWIVILVLGLIGVLLWLIYVLVAESTQKNITWVEVDKYVPATAEPSGDQKIPRIIHQTFVSNVIPSTLYERTLRWRRLNPEYEYHYYTNEDCLKFIRENGDPELIEAYETLIPGAAKADLWRYCVLYKYGGVYVDIPSAPLKPLKDIISPDDDLVTVLDVLYGNQRDADGMYGQNIYNAFIGVTPNHPLMKKCIQMSVQRILKNEPECVFGLTGPALMALAYETGDGVLPHMKWRHNLRQTNEWGNVRFYQNTPYANVVRDGNGVTIIDNKYSLYYKRDRPVMAGYHYTTLKDKKLIFKEPLPTDRMINNDWQNTIIQTYDSRYGTKRMMVASASWKDTYENFNYRLVTEEGRATDVAKFSDDALAVYQTLRSDQLKLDLWKLCSLYLYGGIYVNMGITALRPFSVNNKLSLSYHTTTKKLSDHIIAGPPNLRFIKSAVLEMINRLKSRSYDWSATDVTAVSILRTLINQSTMNVAYYKVTDPFIYHNQMKIGKIPYPEYQAERLVLGGNDHSYLWKNRTAFKVL